MSRKIFFFFFFYSFSLSPVNWNQNKREPPKMGLFSVNQNVRLIKEDGTKIQLIKM